MIKYFPTLALGLAVLAASTTTVRPATIVIPNGSFEAPLAPRESPYAFPYMAEWQKSPQPDWYTSQWPWEALLGTFYNAPISTYIDNCDGEQAAFVFAVPEVALFQDYDSIGDGAATPSHAFDARFNVNSAYRLTVGVISTPTLYYGATLELSLYYRDSTNLVTVAAATLTNSAELFPTNTHFVDCSVYLPGVWATNAWAGQHIGVRIASTVAPDLATGYWDVDNARLAEIPLPALTDVWRTNGCFGCTLQSQPGLRFTMLAGTNLSLPLSNWTPVATLTNDTGAIAFVDPAAGPNRQFYRAVQLP